MKRSAVVVGMAAHVAKEPKSQTQVVKVVAAKVEEAKVAAVKEVPVERVQVVTVHREVTSKPRSVSCGAADHLRRTSITA